MGTIALFAFALSTLAKDDYAKMEEFISKERAKAMKNYDKEEHGAEGNFVNTYISMSLDAVVSDYLTSKGMKKLPKKHITTGTYEGLSAQAAAEYRAKSFAANSEENKASGESFLKEKLSCEDMELYPHVYEPKKQCSPGPKSNCFREHVAEFPGPSKFKADKCPKEKVVLTKNAAEILGKDEYADLRDVSLKIKDYLGEKMKIKTLGISGAELVPGDTPLTVDGASGPGTDYSAAYLLDGSFIFRNREKVHTAKNGLVFWSSGLENVFEARGPRLQLRFTCSPEYNNDELLEKVAKRPGKGKVLNESLKGDWRLGGIFAFVLCWMFRF